MNSPFLVRILNWHNRRIYLIRNSHDTLFLRFCYCHCLYRKAPVSKTLTYFLESLSAIIPPKSRVTLAPTFFFAKLQLLASGTFASNLVFLVL